MNRGVPSKAKDPKYVLRHLLKYIKQFKFRIHKEWVEYKSFSY